MRFKGIHHEDAMKDLKELGWARAWTLPYNTTIADDGCRILSFLRFSLLSAFSDTDCFPKQVDRYLESQGWLEAVQLPYFWNDYNDSLIVWKDYPELGFFKPLLLSKRELYLENEEDFDPIPF